jgi:hypothetical protein
LFSDGHLEALKDDFMNCHYGGNVLNSFHFDAGLKRFNYKCATAAEEPIDSKMHYTSYSRGADKGLNYLDRHFVNCPNNGLLRYVDLRVRGNEIRFRYLCEQYSPTLDYQCHDRSTRWDFRGEDDTLIYLDCQNIQCNADEGLSNFLVHSRVYNGDDQIKYDYRCCSMTSDVTTATPTVVPTPTPTVVPTDPTTVPTATPTIMPIANPTFVPSASPIHLIDVLSVDGEVSTTTSGSGKYSF